jgi:hypothetical protein
VICAENYQTFFQYGNSHICIRISFTALSGANATEFDLLTQVFTVSHVPENVFHSTTIKHFIYLTNTYFDIIVGNGTYCSITE